MYKDPWTLEWDKKLKAINKPKNVEDKFAVPIMKNDCLVGHLLKEKTGKIAKIVFISYTSVIVTSVRWKSLANL